MNSVQCLSRLLQIIWDHPLRRLDRLDQLQKCRVVIHVPGSDIVDEPAEGEKSCRAGTISRLLFQLPPT